MQVGGGLRQAGDVAAVLAAGAARAVLGTVALSDPALIEGLVADHGDRIVVSADSRDGHVAIEGWARETRTTSAELITGLAARGVRRFVFTPVEVDGTLEGPGGGRRVAAAAATVAPSSSTRGESARSSICASWRRSRFRPSPASSSAVLFTRSGSRSPRERRH